LLANLESSIVASVLFKPVPQTIGILPLAYFILLEISSFFSSNESVADSPVVPQITI